MNNLSEKQTIEQIRSDYLQGEVSKVEKLKKFHKSVLRPAIIFAYAFGIIGALTLGAGMCLAMKVIGNLMVLGIIVGCVGIAMVCTTYPLYKRLVKNRKKKYSMQIIALSDELLNS